MYTLTCNHCKRTLKLNKPKTNSPEQIIDDARSANWQAVYGKNGVTTFCSRFCKIMHQPLPATQLV